MTDTLATVAFSIWAITFCVTWFVMSMKLSEVEAENVALRTDLESLQSAKENDDAS